MLREKYNLATIIHLKKISQDKKMLHSWGSGRCSVWCLALSFIYLLVDDPATVIHLQKISQDKKMLHCEARGLFAVWLGQDCL